ncbi:MAG: cytochrome b N-terminal domain-containing protein [Ignavibacteria bacterium]|nr:cytochrome b N-terminal domain-containing protein [Ignavibacteria bacterium]
MLINVISWIEERLPVQSIKTFFIKKNVPRHRHSIWYYFGGMTLLFFVVQIVTGILLTFYYTPTPEKAHESVMYIVNEVPYGWLIRSLHAWSANLMIGAMFIHMFSAFLMVAYRKPRELLWVSGALLMFVVLGFGFTGYLLPWDTMAYFATLIGTEVPATMPVIGDWGVSLLKGSEEVGAETLTRMYSIHTVVLPLVSLLLVSFHLGLNQLYGASVPVGTETPRKPIPFFPNFLYRDLLSWTLGLGILIALATILPSGLGEKADPLASAPLGIKPEWYFLPLYQSLRMAPAEVFSLSGDFIVNLLVAIGCSVWLAIPFLDRKASAGRKSLPFMVLGIVLILYLITTILLAYVLP